MLVLVVAVVLAVGSQGAATPILVFAAIMLAKSRRGGYRRSRASGRL